MPKLKRCKRVHQHTQKHAKSNKTIWKHMKAPKSIQKCAKALNDHFLKILWQLFPIFWKIWEHFFLPFWKFCDDFLQPFYIFYHFLAIYFFVFYAVQSSSLQYKSLITFSREGDVKVSLRTACCCQKVNARTHTNIETRTHARPLTHTHTPQSTDFLFAFDRQKLGQLSKSQEGAFCELSEKSNHFDSLSMSQS